MTRPLEAIPVELNFDGHIGDLWVVWLPFIMRLLLDGEDPPPGLRG